MVKCKKRRYRDSIAAKLALTQVSAKDHRRIKTEKRIYYCRLCSGYHLTSVPLRESV